MQVDTIMFIKNLDLTYVEGKVETNKVSTTVSLLLDILFLFKASKVSIHSDFFVYFTHKTLLKYSHKLYSNCIVIIVGNDNQKSHSFIH